MGQTRVTSEGRLRRLEYFSEEPRPGRRPAIWRSRAAASKQIIYSFVNYLFLRKGESFIQPRGVNIKALDIRYSKYFTFVICYSINIICTYRCKLVLEGI